jgi:TetR/AcrR family transcriptional regulator of autoinduction and epiphytic fitness
MRENVNNSRTYVSPRRREQAQATRRAVLEAARLLFVEAGYVSTSIAGIAARANVSAETVYAIFGTKRAILAGLVDISIAGGDDAGPILDQAWVDELRTEPDIHRRLAILAHNGRSILERRAAIDEVVRGAATADPDIAALWQRGKAERLAGQRELLRIVVGAGLREGLDLETAADILYAIGSPETYRLLVAERGWTGEQFEVWYGETLARLLLA